MLRGSPSRAVLGFTVASSRLVCNADRSRLAAPGISSASNRCNRLTVCTGRWDSSSRRSVNSRSATRACPLGGAFARLGERENAVFRGSGRGHAVLSIVSGLLAGSCPVIAMKTASRFAFESVNHPARFALVEPLRLAARAPAGLVHPQKAPGTCASTPVPLVPARGYG